MIQNPSAGKFDPPPPPTDPMERPPLHKRWWFITLILVGYSAKYWLRGTHGIGSVIGVTLLFVAGILKVVESRSRHGEQPYSPPHNVTR